MTQHRWYFIQTEIKRKVIRIFDLIMFMCQMWYVLLWPLSWSVYVKSIKIHISLAVSIWLGHLILHVVEFQLGLGNRYYTHFDLESQYIDGKRNNCNISYNGASFRPFFLSSPIYSIQLGKNPNYVNCTQVCVCVYVRTLSCSSIYVYRFSK